MQKKKALKAFIKKERLLNIGCGVPNYRDFRFMFCLLQNEIPSKLNVSSKCQSSFETAKTKSAIKTLKQYIKIVQR